MSISWEKNILKTYTVSLNALWLQKNGPPGQAPRPGLEWKEETHRWVRPRTGGEGGPKRKKLLHKILEQIFLINMD